MEVTLWGCWGLHTLYALSWSCLELKIKWDLGVGPDFSDNIRNDIDQELPTLFPGGVILQDCTALKLCEMQQRWSLFDCVHANIMYQDLLC